MGIVSGIGGCDYVQYGTIVQDNRYKLENVDGDQQVIQIVLLVHQRALLHFLWKFQMPPKA